MRRDQDVGATKGVVSPVGDVVEDILHGDLCAVIGRLGKSILGERKTRGRKEKRIRSAKDNERRSIGFISGGDWRGSGLGFGNDSFTGF